MKNCSCSPLLQSYITGSHSLTAHHFVKGNSFLKRAFSVFLALALILASAFALTPVKVYADQVILDFTSDVEAVKFSKFYGYLWNSFYYSCDLGSFYSIISNLPSDCCVITGYRSTFGFGGVYLHSDGHYVLGYGSSPVFTSSSQYLGVKYLSDFNFTNVKDLLDPSVKYLVFKDYDTAASYAQANSKNVCYLSGFDGTSVFFNVLSYTTLQVIEIIESSRDIFNVNGEFSSNVSFSVPASNSIVFHSSYQYVANPPTVPLLETSFDDQIVYIAEDETYNLFVNAENVNGTPTIDWYALRQNEDGTWSNGEVQYTGGLEKYADGCYIGGWKYTPDADAAPYIIMFKAVVTNAVGDLTATAESGFVVLHVTSYDDPGSGGSGTDTTTPDSGGDSETLGKLEQLDTDIQEVQQTVSEVGEKVDQLGEQVEQLPDEIVDGMGELMEQEKENSKNEGSDAADQVIDIIPNQSMDFLSALNKLIEVLNYEGTDAVLTFPGIYIPAISGLFPRIQIMESREIDFEYWVNQMPTNILALVRALFDVAIVGYCLKELLSLIGSAVNGFGEGLGKQLAEE